VTADSARHLRQSCRWLVLLLALALGQAAARDRPDGATVERQVVSLEVRRSGHYTETVERTVRIDSAAGIAAHAESWLSPCHWSAPDSRCQCCLRPHSAICWTTNWSLVA
jgi:hypothetical protein